MPGIKAIIFDLDDTLFDCTGLLVSNARKRAAKAIVEAGFPGGEEEIYSKLIGITDKNPRADIFEELRKHGISSTSVIKAGEDAYNSDVVEDIHTFANTHGVLRKLRARYKLALVTTGVYKRQKKKIELLDIEKFFDIVIINDTERGGSLEDCFRNVIERLKLEPSDIISVGDRIQSEVKVANRLGMISVRILHGRFSGLSPKSSLETPDFEISELDGLFDVIEKASQKNYKVVVVGGGTGLPVILEGIKKYTGSITAVVTVTDSARSSGDIRKNLNILPPGDIRNCLIALSNSEKTLRELFQYRFEDGDYTGLSLGNLFIAALTKITGNFNEGIKEASRILKLQGRVLPATLQDTHICAELENGNVIEEEFNITHARTDKSPIKRVFLKDSGIKAFEEVAEAIENADIIVLGPGCLFTSVIANLLVKGIPEAIRKSRAKKIYVCNIATQPGQTDGYKASDHVKKIIEYLGEGALDYVILNNGKADKSVIEAYKKCGSFLIENDNEIDKMGVKVVKEDVLASEELKNVWDKQDLLKHDPDKIAKTIISIANGSACV